MLRKSPLLLAVLALGAVIAGCSERTPTRMAGPETAGGALSPDTANPDAGATVGMTLGAQASALATLTASPEETLAVARTLVATVSRGRAQAESVFSGVGGLVGIVAQENGQRSIVWMTAKGEALLPVALGADGSNLTEKALTEQGVYQKPDGVLAELALPAARSIMAGTKGPIATVFMDPNCGYCRKLFHDLQPALNAGKLRIRFVMVGFLAPDSTTKSAAIIASKNPLEALTAVENGGTAPGTPGAEHIATVEANTRHLGAVGPISTPATLACTKDGVTIVRGSPPDVDAFVATLREEGHPACAR